jgi:6-phosphogluconolactonase
MQQQVTTFDDLESLSLAAARALIDAVGRSIEQRRLCSLVLSGGSSPRRLYELLAQPPFKDQINWQKLHVFWSDERCVGPDDPRSNYHLASSSLLRHVPLPPDNIHRMPGEIDPSQAAGRSAEDIRSFFGKDAAGQFPSFDCVLLGMGADGHIASLFPAKGSTFYEEELVLETRAPEGMPSASRLSMSMGLLTAAREIFFIVSGKDKRPMLDMVLAEDTAVRDCPAARFCERARASWFVAA